MMHPKLRWVMFTAALGIVACKGDPTDSLRNGAKELRASPGSVFVPQGDSVAIVTELRDEQGNRLVADFTMTSSDPANLPVDKDLGFLPVYDENNQLIPPTDATRSRFFVKGIGLTSGTLTATSGGLTQTIPVFSLPSVQGSIFGVANLSSTTTALGDTVTVTIPAPWKFSPSAVALATLPGRAVTVGVSADSSSLRFIPGPGIDTTVSFRPAVLTYGPTNDPFAPALDTFRLSSSAFLNSPPIGPVTISSTAPALGVPVTATAPAGFVFTTASTVLVIDTTAHDTTLTAVTGLSPDSSQLTFIPAPNGTGLVEIDRQIVEVTPALGPYTLQTTQSLTSATLTTLPANFSSSTPAGGTVVSMTIPGFKFIQGPTVTFGTQGSFIESVSADSNTLFFVPPPGATGAPTVGGVALSFLLGAPLSLPTSTAITVGSSPFPGTDAIATAPLLPIPAAGVTDTLYDGASFAGADIFGPDQYYKLQIATTTTFTLQLNWDTDSDVDIIWLLGDLSDFACNFDGATGNQPEASTCTLTPGDYYLLLNLFDPGSAAPGVLQMVVSNP